MFEAMFEFFLTGTGLVSTSDMVDFSSEDFSSPDPPVPESVSTSVYFLPNSSGYPI